MVRELSSQRRRVAQNALLGHDWIVGIDRHESDADLLGRCPQARLVERASVEENHSPVATIGGRADQLGVRRVGAIPPMEVKRPSGLNGQARREDCVVEQLHYRAPSRSCSPIDTVSSMAASFSSGYVSVMAAHPPCRYTAARALALNRCPFR